MSWLSDEAEGVCVCVIINISDTSVVSSRWRLVTDSDSPDEGKRLDLQAEWTEPYVHNIQ